MRIFSLPNRSRYKAALPLRIEGTGWSIALGGRSNPQPKIVPVCGKLRRSASPRAIDSLMVHAKLFFRGHPFGLFSFLDKLLDPLTALVADSLVELLPVCLGGSLASSSACFLDSHAALGFFAGFSPLFSHFQSLHDNSLLCKLQCPSTFPVPCLWPFFLPR